MEEFQDCVGVDLWPQLTGESPGFGNAGCPYIVKPSWETDATQFFLR
jgi:hypothetical protein